MSEEDQVDKILKWARRSSMKERLRGMIDVLHPEVALRHEQLDTDPWLLNCLNGTIDLRTGDFLPHQREHYITKIAPVEYNPDAKAPTWDQFLDQIFAGNQRLIDYVKRFTGYSLTGLIIEQCVAFLHGSGANGKTTYVNALRGVFGDYAQEAAPDLLLDNRHNAITNDIARLRGTRFVTVTETSDGRNFDEGRIKRLSGGDKITARFLRQEFFEFDPTHKLLIISNYKPTLKGTDWAIWRRIKLIPFEVTFAKDQQDPDLLAKLLKEKEGILAWAVQGCLEWQQFGLSEPEEVTVATDSYRHEMDLVQRFIDEWCILDSSAHCMATGLYEAFKFWTELNGEKYLSAQMFGRKLSEKGFTSDHKREGNAWNGLRLNVPLEYEFKWQQHKTA